MGGEGGLGGGDGQQAGDLGDGGVVASGLILRRVGDRGRQQAAQRVDELVVRVPGKQEAEVRRFRVGVHGRAYCVYI